MNEITQRHWAEQKLGLFAERWPELLRMVCGLEEMDAGNYMVALEKLREYGFYEIEALLIWRAEWVLLQSD